MKKKTEQALRAQIRQILEEDWDPIALRGVVPDEYDSYISGVLKLLARGATKADIVWHLRKLESGSMGLEPHPARLEPVAESLLKLADAL